jgi:hypothetical protein
MSKLPHRPLTWALGAAALLGLSAYPLTTHSASAGVDVTVNQHAPLRLDHNPRIHKALDALRDARQELADAPHDFHGKKQEAMDAVDKAISKLDEIKDFEN